MISSKVPCALDQGYKEVKKRRFRNKKGAKVLGLFDGEMGILLQRHELTIILMFLYFIACV